FTRARDASKITLMYLCARLIRGGFVLLDTQFITPHLAQFGTVEIPRREFKVLLNIALGRKGDYHALAETASPDDVLSVLDAAQASTRHLDE
ncbi:MAG: leucyl/phenylalanyl-tRNA--protein transferase, partial [Pseudomonadota bacterium]